MLKKLKILIADDKTEAFSSFYFNASDLTEESRKKLESLVSTMPESEISMMVSWLDAIHKIRSSDINDAQKEAAIRKLPTSDVSLGFIRSCIFTLIEQSDFEHKSEAKNMLQGLGIAVSILNIEIAGLSLLALHAIIPKLLLSESGVTICDYLTQTLTRTRASNIEQRRG